MGETPEGVECEVLDVLSGRDNVLQTYFPFSNERRISFAETDIYSFVENDSEQLRKLRFFFEGHHFASKKKRNKDDKNTNSEASPPPPPPQKNKFFRNLCGRICAPSGKNEQNESGPQPVQHKKQPKPQDFKMMSEFNHARPAQTAFPREDVIHSLGSSSPENINHPDPVGPLLGPQRKENQGKKTLVLDLDETLVHSSYTATARYDFTVPAEVDDHWIEIYVAIRPGVSQFLSRVYEKYELVIFTASLGKYAHPVINFLDPNGLFCYRLFRESCSLRWVFFSFNLRQKWCICEGFVKIGSRP
eukprot:GHVP01053265.1.p1 GENE.GHVP01053265.1~~GHVP01053265.1.p1  ORF type:complete len:303 (-),score=55.01 GHVP01053265.1:1177-2085(-)